MDPGPRISRAIKREALRSCWFFQPMRVEEIDEIVSHSQERRVAAKTTIFHRGDPGASLLAVLAGKVDIKLSGAEGNKEIAYRRVMPGEIFGEIALLDGKPRTADAVAVEDSTLVVVERRVFMPILLRHEGLVERMFDVLCSRIRSTSISLEEVALFDAPTRLARVLCRMAFDYGRERPGGGVLIDFKMSDNEWSMLLGALARETVNRHMNRWQTQGLLARADGYVTVLDMTGLRQLAAGGGLPPDAEEAPRRDRAR